MGHDLRLGRPGLIADDVLAHVGLLDLNFPQLSQPVDGQLNIRPVRLSCRVR